jgi:hypothetical protein
MTPITLFLLGCIPARLLLVFLSTKIPKDKLVYFGILLLTISMSFLYLYFTNNRLSAPEAGGITWWSQLRLIHGLLYLTAAIYAIQGKDLVWIPLLIDVIFGLISFTNHHLFKK